jgi:hypothetical protein
MLGHKKADGQTEKPGHTSDAAPQLWQPTRLVLLAIFILCVQRQRCVVCVVHAPTLRQRQL